MDKVKKVICIGSGAKDVFFPTKEAKIIDNPGNLEIKQLMAFEYGAKYQIDDRFEAPGGCAANCAQGLARLGIDVACYCRVGNDFEGQWVKENLRREKVDISLVQIDDKYKTDLSFILVNMKDGDRTIFFNRDANEKLEIKDDIEAEWVFVSALNGDWQGSLDKIITQAKAKNVKLAINPGQANLKENKSKVIEFIKNSEIIIANRDEAITITGQNNDDFKFLVQELHKLGPKIVVITDGLNGSVGSNKSEILFAPAIKEKPVDLTGAGDAFGAAFLAAIIKGRNLSESLQWGTANGSNVVKFYGAKEGLLNEKQIIEKAKLVGIKKL